MTHISQRTNNPDRDGYKDAWAAKFAQSAPDADQSFSQAAKTIYASSADEVHPERVTSLNWAMLGR